MKLMAEYNPGSMDTNPIVSANSRDTTASEATVPTSNSSSLHPADVRRFLTTQSTSKRSVNMARCKYTVSSHKGTLPGALIDSGSNGGIAGSDVCVVGFHPYAKIDVEGIDNHRMTGLHIATVVATVKSNIGDIIVVLHHYGYTGKGTTSRTVPALSIGGVVFGIATNAVYPPSTPPILPDSIVSASSWPGWRRWACRSMNPGET